MRYAFSSASGPGAEYVVKRCGISQHSARPEVTDDSDPLYFTLLTVLSKDLTLALAKQTFDR